MYKPKILTAKKTTSLFYKMRADDPVIAMTVATSSAETDVYLLTCLTKITHQPGFTEFLNLLAPGRFENNFQNVFFKLIF